MANPIVEFPRDEQRSVIAPPAALPAAPAQPSVITVSTAPPPLNWQPPVFGSLAVIFGITALFKATVVLAPLGLAFALAALLRRQYPWAAIGAGAAAGALLTSPLFWTLIGLAWLLKWLM